jgi:hypothetical protein
MPIWSSQQRAKISMHGEEVNIEPYLLFTGTLVSRVADPDPYGTVFI